MLCFAGCQLSAKFARIAKKSVGGYMNSEMKTYFRESGKAAGNQRFLFTLSIFDFPPESTKSPGQDTDEGSLASNMAAPSPRNQPEGTNSAETLCEK